MRRGAWLGLLAMAGCGSGQEGRGLGLLEFRQMDFESVALNEELLFFFTSDLDRSSVTSDSVRILDEQGRDVAGELSVRRNALSFLPELPCASDLSDGGLRPHTSYRVVLGGFPRPDGIRSASGELLSASLVLGFRTADFENGPLFLDPFLGPFALLPLGRRTNLEDGLLVLEYGEALDPSSVPNGHFELSPAGASKRESIPIVARLIENRRNHALLLLEPLGSGSGGPERLPPDTYYLLMRGRELRTLGGRQVEPGWNGVLQLSVPQARVELDFSTLGEQSNEPPPGCDGTAIRNENGPGLQVRFPAAAGLGLAGEVELRSAPPEADLQATDLSIPAGAAVDLSDFTAPVVLRSQTTLEVRGRLVRRGTGRQDPPTHLASELDPAQQLERAASLPESRRATLSSWLERLLASEPPGARVPWTVLIAGGDIRVAEGGSIEVDGPLVLVAGGLIRVEGHVLAHGDLWHTEVVGEGGGMASRTRNAPLPLTLDPPPTNPLRTRLSLGAVTPPFHWTPRSSGWLPTIVGQEGIGRVNVRFLQVVPGADGERQVSDPSELGPGFVRALVRLELEPGHGEPWFPPRFERLRLEAVAGRLPTGARR